MGFAFAKGYTKGISQTRFDPTAAMTATQYLTFILRALGYVDGIDFEWNAAWEFSDKLGTTHGKYDSDYNSLLHSDLYIALLFSAFWSAHSSSFLLSGSSFGLISFCT